MLFPLEISTPAALFILIAPHHGFVLATSHSTIADPIYLMTRAHQCANNLHKSNAANERLADGLRHGRAGPWRYTSGQDSLILTALATMRKKTRLAAVP